MTGMRTMTVVARHQWRVMVRDRRLALCALVVIALAVTAIATAAVRQQRLDVERAVAAADDERAWAAMGTANPHDAAHFGRTVFKPFTPLALLDPGVSDHLGTVARLEAHKQQPAHGRPAESGTLLSRFGGISAAFMLQALVPLLIILAGFSTFTGADGRELLRLELAAGVGTKSLFTGRALGLGAAVAMLLALVTAAGAGALWWIGGSPAGYVRLALMVLGYAVYLCTVLALTLGVSAWAPSTKHALVVLLSFWTISVLLVPRLAPMLAERRHPTPSLAEVQAAVSAEVRRRPQRDDATSIRLAQVTETLLKEHGVSSIDELPVHMGGISLEVEEEVSAERYRRHFARVYDTYRAQARVLRMFTVVSPLLALRPWSAALAEADAAAHQRFLDDAERYRYRVVQALNRDLTLHAKALKFAYVTDLKRIAFEPFVTTPGRISDVWRLHGVDFIVLMTWAGVSLGLSWTGARRLARRP
jgi:ABC-2 type transport system permease protein